MRNTEEIQTILPHRYPMLLIDRILEMTPGKHCVGTKTVSVNDRLITGTGGRKFFPHTLIIEAMAQVAGIPMGSPDTAAAMMVGLEEFVFEGLACPGDVIRIEGTVLWVRGKLFKVSVEACTDAGFQARGCVVYAYQDGLRATDE